MRRSQSDGNKNRLTAMKPDRQVQRSWTSEFARPGRLRNTQSGGGRVLGIPSAHGFVLVWFGVIEHFGCVCEISK